MKRELDGKPRITYRQGGGIDEKESLSPRGRNFEFLRKGMRSAIGASNKLEAFEYAKELVSSGPEMARAVWNDLKGLSLTSADMTLLPFVAESERIFDSKLSNDDSRLEPLAAVINVLSGKIRQNAIGSGIE